MGDEDQPASSGDDLYGSLKPLPKTVQKPFQKRLIPQGATTMQKVYVQDKHGEPLDPTNPARARQLMQKGRAEPVQRDPFTIRMLDRTREESTVHKVTLGIDAGYSKVGFSAITTDGEREMIKGVLELRNDILQKLEERKKYRRNRRSRNTRYREPRFDNRKRDDGWLAPSIQHKLDKHEQLVQEIKKILPVDKVRVEVAKFDQQKLQDPEISGKEYQHGTLDGYNVKNYLLEKFNYKCAYCGKTDVPLEVEHIVPKSRGGSDRVDNLTISCRECNQEKGNQTAEEFGYPEVQEKANETLKATAFMNQVRWKLTEKLDADHTFGHITKKKRLDMNLDKNHWNDAFVIANGRKNTARSDTTYNPIYRRRNNRSIQMNRKTYGRSVRTERYEISPGDTVCKNGTEAVAKGVHSYGRYVKVDYPPDPNWKTEDTNIVKYRSGMQFEQMPDSSPT